MIKLPFGRLPLLNVSTMKPITGKPKNVAAGLSEVSLCAFTGPVNEAVKSNNAQPFCAFAGSVEAVRSLTFAEPRTLLPLNVTTFAS